LNAGLGLWWGAEKIWNGELVRLLTLEEDLDIARHVDDIGSLVDRRFFLLIAGIFRHGPTQHAMVTGTVWELCEASRDQGADEAPVERYMPKPPPGHRFKKLTREGELHFLGESLREFFFFLTRADDRQKTSNI
jgi:hypothetical protein